MKLTDREIKNLKADTKDLIKSDGNGLYLRVMVTGNKVFLLRQKHLGKDVWRSLGSYPELTLADARVLVRDLKSSGVIANYTLGEAYLEFKTYAEGFYKQPEVMIGRLERDIIPALGAMKLHSISRSDVTKALKVIVDRGSKVTANRTLTDIKQLFIYCEQKGWVASNPVEGVNRKFVGGAEKSRKRHLSFAELHKLIHILMTRNFDPKTKLIVALLITTGQRVSEIIGYHPSEVKGKLWTIPAERTKGEQGESRAQKVYLSPISRALFKMWQPCSFDYRTIDRAVKRMDMDFTPHDLRRTMATRLGDLGVMPHVVEKMLNHVMVGVMEVYNRAEYLPERREAWLMWGGHISKLRHEVRSQLRSPSS